MYLEGDVLLSGDADGYELGVLEHAQIRQDKGLGCKHLTGPGQTCQVWHLGHQGCGFRV